MKFNLSASVKLVAQRLNPDLTIPDRDTKPSPPSSSASASASAPTSRNGRKSPSHSSLSLSTRNNSHQKGKNASHPSLSLSVPTNNTTTITSTGAKLSKSNSNRRDKGKNPASSSSSSSSNTTTTPPSPEIVLTPPTSHHRDFAKARDSITRTEAPGPSPISAASFPAPGKSTWKTVNRPTTPLVFSSPGVDNSGPTTTAATTTSTYKSTLDPGSVNSRTGGFGTLTGPSIPQAAVEMAANTSTPTLSTAPAATTNATVSSVRAADKSLPYFPRAGLATDGYTTSTEATATCFCGAVQLSFPTEAPGLVGTFVCNCTDCRKITASMFASNFTVRDEYLHHLRGKQNLKTFSQSETVASGHAMTNHFCCICGSLMYRVGAAFPGCSILRLGTVDDFSLVETKLRPMREDFVKDRVGWLGGVLGEDVKRSEGMP